MLIKRLSLTKQRVSDLFHGLREINSAILMYHRINDEGCDPWRSCVTPDNFRAQMTAILDAGFKTTTVSRMVSRLASGDRPQRTIAVSFDDGYVDNLANAYPILRQHGIPATIFVTSGYLTGEREYWWDALERAFLLPGTLPNELELALPKLNARYRLGDAATLSPVTYRETLGWKAYEPPPTARHHLYLTVWKALSEIPADERASAVDFITRWAGQDAAPRESHRPMTGVELRNIAADPNIEIGAHSVSHSPLASLSSEKQRKEIRDSKMELECLLGIRIGGMSYPHGSHSCETAKVAREEGYDYACTTVNRPVRKRQALMSIPRILAPDVTITSFRNDILSRISR